MDFLAGIVAIFFVSLIDPVMWVGPIVGAVAFRRWWAAVGLGVVCAIVDFMLLKAFQPVPMPADKVAEAIVGRLVTGVVFGFIAIGVASLYRRRKKKPTQPTS
jgi:hypothetical protein